MTWLNRLGFLLAVGAVAALLFDAPRLAALGMALAGLLVVATVNYKLKSKRER